MESSKTKYHPILFSTPMVQAILENRKRQTRRTKGLEEVNKNPDLWVYDGISIFANYPPQKNDNKIHHSFINLQTGRKHHILCPFEVGDVFWVRETFAEWPKGMFQYKASTHIGSEIGKWKPSIFMPKEACRIFLKLKSIKVERLQQISREDARSEGIELDLSSGTKFKNYIWKTTTYSEKTSFFSLWESINGKKSLELNPFVWVYEFEVIEKPTDFIV